MATTDEKLEELRKDYACQARRAFDRVMGLCESPIERLFVATMMTGDFFHFEVPAERWLHEHVDELDSEDKSQAFFRSLIREPDSFREWDEPVWASINRDVVLDGRTFRPDIQFRHAGAKLAVELDGHDFHERTKEQAARDKGRDRLFQLHGWTVARFTGAEVYADAHRCVLTTMRMVLRTSPNAVLREWFEAMANDFATEAS